MTRWVQKRRRRRNGTRCFFTYSLDCVNRYNTRLNPTSWHFNCIRGNSVRANPIKCLLRQTEQSDRVSFSLVSLSPLKVSWWFQRCLDTQSGGFSSSAAASWVCKCDTVQTRFCNFMATKSGQRQRCWPLFYYYYYSDCGNRNPDRLLLLDFPPGFVGGKKRSEPAISLLLGTYID